MRASEGGELRMIVFSNSTDSLPIALQTATKIAKILGFKVFTLSPDRYTAALTPGLTQPQKTWGIWLSALPALESYTAVYQAALANNIRLLNTPEQHCLAQDFDRVYSLLQGLVPVPPANSWEAVRQQTPLRYCQTAADGSPLGRSFRVFVCDRTILTYGYVWADDDPLKWLTVEDEAAIFGVVLQAAERLSIPFIAIDVGQQASGRWVVLAICDAQFASFAQLPIIHFWYELEKMTL
jgi:ATP-grasp domain, R2K clade family 3